ncbi:methylosome protein 50-like [Harmonia axyridis]|uniref:methylosome protein 50-like n=1 Tax=Harmonia axyridis TaxID=115357 RepID=UPI001E274DE3|nr:methylosome protein 50-like [Harmonia axyridis]
MRELDTDNIIVYPPNKILETNYIHPQTPNLKKSLMFIDFNSKSEAIIGSSNINGTLWDGSTAVFQSTTDLENLKWSKFYIGSSVCDAKYLDDITIVLAEDTGDVQVLDIDENVTISPYLVYKHFSRVPQIAVWFKSSKILTCSDRTVAVIDIECSRKIIFPDYHTESIYSVDSLTNNSNHFVSCGADRNVLIWDRRDHDTASVLYTDEFADLTSVAWNQSNEDFIVCGTEGGTVYHLDRRQPKSTLEFHHCFENRIHRLSFNPNSNQVAICGDTNEVIVLDKIEGSYTNIYNSEEHSDMVRGLCWNENILYSCGFDAKICKHIF